MVISIRPKVPMPLKLEFVVCLGLRKAGFDVGCDGLQAAGVQGARQVFAAFVRVFGVEEAVIQAEFCGDGAATGGAGFSVF